MIPEPRNLDTNRRLLVPSLARLGAGLEPLIYFLIRVSAGLFLAMHAAQKLFGWFGGNAANEAWLQLRSYRHCNRKTVGT